MEFAMVPVQIIVTDVQGQPGSKMLRFVDQMGNIFTAAPIDEKASKTVAAKLGSGIMVASAGQLPPLRDPGGNGARH